MSRVAKSLRRAFAHGESIEARTDMSFASLLGGLALANAGLGVVHGFAAAIGGMFGRRTEQFARHCSRTACAPMVRSRDIAKLPACSQARGAEDGIQWVSDLCADLRIPPLRVYGIGEQHVEVLCAKASAASSMKANPISLSTLELQQTLRAAL